MAPHHWLLAVAAVGLAVVSFRGTDADSGGHKAPARVVMAKLEAARKTFETMWVDKQWTDAEIPYRWSCRWLDAHHELSEKADDRVAACQAHRDRMHQLERITRLQFENRLVGIAQVSAAEYYVAEAEGWLADCKERGAARTRPHADRPR